MKDSKHVLAVAVLSAAFVCQTLDLTAAGEASAGNASAMAINSQTGIDQKRLNREVKHSIEAFRKAMVEADPGVILAYSMPELSFGHSNGVVQTREQFAEVVRSKAEDFKRVELTNRRLEIVGDTAIERHHFSADIVYEGKLRNFELEVVEVWRKVDDYWRLFVRQAFKT